MLKTRLPLKTTSGSLLLVGAASATACGLDDARAYLQKCFAQGYKFSDGEGMGFGDGVTQFEHQPIGGGVQNEAYLIGERLPTGCAIRRQLALVQFDQIFHLAARAIERVVDMFG